MVRDETVREYTREWDSAKIRRDQQEILRRETNLAMDELLARHDAGGELTEEEIRQLTIHICGPDHLDQ